MRMVRCSQATTRQKQTNGKQHVGKCVQIIRLSSRKFNWKLNRNRIHISCSSKTTSWQFSNPIDMPALLNVGIVCYFKFANLFLGCPGDTGGVAPLF